MKVLHMCEHVVIGCKNWSTVPPTAQLPKAVNVISSNHPHCFDSLSDVNSHSSEAVLLHPIRQPYERGREQVVMSEKGEGELGETFPWQLVEMSITVVERHEQQANTDFSPKTSKS